MRRKQLEEADPDLLRALMQTVLEDLMGTEIDQICGASYGERSEIRENSRNGYRSRLLQSIAIWAQTTRNRLSDGA